MQFNNHFNLQGKHAIFSASQSAWLRYDEEKAAEVYANRKAAELGTRKHEWAAETIRLGIKQSKSKTTLNMYINDAIGFKMQPEVVLYYSDRFFGTADAISFRKEKREYGTVDVLRIHDLKTGVTSVKMDQLLVYVALFCLEYRIKPGEIEIELRIYQNDEILYHNPTAEEIVPIMDKIISFNKMLERLEEGV